jgi:hypothetical protein
VPRTLVSRLVACLLALTAGFAAPAAALAHWHAHHWEAEANERHHDDDHHHGDAHQHANVPSPVVAIEHADDVAVIAEGAEDGGNDHAHPELDGAPCTRVEWPAFAVVVLRVVLAVETRAIAPRVPVVEREQRPGDLAHAPPPSSRAPPSLLG